MSTFCRPSNTVTTKSRLLFTLETSPSTGEAIIRKYFVPGKEAGMVKEKELKKEDLSILKSTDFNNLVFPAFTSTKEILLPFPIKFFAKTSICTSISSPAYTI